MARRESKYTPEELRQRRAQASWEYRQRNQAATNDKARLRMRACGYSCDFWHAPADLYSQETGKATPCTQRGAVGILDEASGGAGSGKKKWRTKQRKGASTSSLTPLSRAPHNIPKYDDPRETWGRHAFLIDTAAPTSYSRASPPLIDVRPPTAHTRTSPPLDLQYDSESDTESEHSEGGWEADNESGKYGENYGGTVYIIGKQTVYYD
ncbi:hypothetical protein R3P38DRAFT_2816417 [Favolaschia claudopus]|uniref:Uncharacterized protein n=1 Tax=Favolaschia claudopus TaxID=2862362 RepID=A0AAV9YYT5_9AGAR